ncbi:MAG: hypothetical protein LBU70_08875 [Chitinispirillales bacterium]|jgi:hypothetical protein|nr:hypothetical protein [Chitinispirillales bacterium]
MKNLIRFTAIGKFTLPALLLTFICATAAAPANAQTVSATPSIMFLIDNSASMYAGGLRLGEDPLGHRFRVTLALLDSIYAVHPDAEVGLAIFTDALQFDASRDERLVRFEGPTTPVANQSFFPPLPLNQSVTPNGFYDVVAAGNAGATYRGLLRSLFSVPSDATEQARIRAPIIGGQYTDISLAFEAAVQAFGASSIAKENQYIIFLSDGEPNVASSHNAGRFARRFDYVSGALQGNLVPTTYTVFLTNGGTREMCPLTLDTVSVIPRGTEGLPRNFYEALEAIGLSVGATASGMTYSIRNNGYSASNPDSDIWVLESDYGNLLNLMDDIIERILRGSSDESESIAHMGNGVGEPPVVRVISAFTAGRNPVVEGEGAVKFFYQGKQVDSGRLTVYDASGRVVRKIRIADSGADSHGKRKVGEWDLRDGRGRPVPVGAYLVRGVINTEGSRERVSVVISVVR